MLPLFRMPNCFTSNTRVVFFAVLLAALPLLAACGGEAAVETGPPDGWQADGAYWWTQGADTAAAFRDLSSVEAMGVVSSTPVLSTSANPTDEQVRRAAKKGLEKLYRKAPETVDSLFAKYVAPELSEVPRTGDMQEHMAAFREKSHEAITEHFYAPVQKLSLGEDIPVPYPDSLRDEGGSVWMQVRVSAEGEPKAIKLLEGAHPVLNDVVRRAVTQMKWEPARVRKGDYGWRDIPSWTWVNVSLS